MILLDEIREHASRVHLANTVVEKDYALSWLLDGIHHHAQTRDDWVLEKSGLEFPKESIKFEVFKNPRETNSIQGRIAYRGPVRPGVGVQLLPRIKIDLTLDEPLQLPPVFKGVDHPYSDLPGS